jgi:hypothetical protein
MTVVRVNPTSVQAYGTDAQARFDAIRTELIALVNAVAEVHYYGPNAVEFKTRAGAMAADFANKLSADLGALADAIRTSTSNIAASLGGQPIVIQVNGATIAAPGVASVDYVDVDTSALEALTGTVNRHFAAINDAFDQHMLRLEGTDWTGNAQVQALTTVRTFTNTAKARTAEAKTDLNSFITSQVQAVVTADR